MVWLSVFIVKYAVLVYKCLHGSALAYLTDELCQGRCRGSSVTSFQFIFCRWPSFSGCHCLGLEQSAWSCRFRTFRNFLAVSAQNPPY